MTTPSENPADAIENIAADAQPSKAAALPVQFVGDEPDETAARLSDARRFDAWFAKEHLEKRLFSSDAHVARAAWEAAIAAARHPPAGFAQVPLHLTQAMNDVIAEEGWQWEDLLAAAGSITLEQYDEIAACNNATRDVLAERERQVAKWGNKHDDEHGHDTLANGAVDFLLPGQSPIEGCSWAFKSKTTDRDPRRLQMVKGAALALAAIEAYDRAEPVGTPGVECPDGGKCHHSCTAVCWRKDSGCVPLSISGLDDNWRRPKAPTGGSGS